MEHTVQGSVGVYDFDVTSRRHYQGVVCYSWRIVLLAPLPWETVTGAAFLHYHTSFQGMTLICEKALWAGENSTLRRNLTWFRSLSPGICSSKIKDLGKRVKRPSECVEPVTHILSPFQRPEKRCLSHLFVIICEKNKHVWLPQGHLLQMNLLTLRRSYLVVTFYDSVDRCPGSWTLWLTLPLNKMPLNKGYWKLSFSAQMCARVCVCVCLYPYRFKWERESVHCWTITFVSCGYLIWGEREGQQKGILRDGGELEA